MNRIKLNKSEHKKNPWITEGLIQSLKFRYKLHMISKTSNLTLVEYQAIKINIKTYNTIIKRLIRKLKRKYIANKFDEHKNNIRRTWQLINDVMDRDLKKMQHLMFLL